MHGSSVSISEQAAFCLDQVMRRLTFLLSADFSSWVQAAKTEGPKTEPAVVTVFNLQAETFAAVMELEDASGAQLAGTLKTLDICGAPIKSEQASQMSGSRTPAAQMPTKRVELEVPPRLEQQQHTADRFQPAHCCQARY